MFWDNFVNQCEKIEKSPTVVVEELGFKRSAVTSWKNGALPQVKNRKKLVETKVKLEKMEIRSSVYQITTDGKLYLRYIDRRKSEMHFANTMSVLAFMVSVIALIVSIIR